MSDELITEKKTSSEKIKDFFRGQLKEIDRFEFTVDSFKIAGDWPILIKVMFTFVIMSILTVSLMQVHFKNQKETLIKLKKEEILLTDQVMQKIDSSAGVDQYVGKIDNMNNSFEDLLSQLPTEIEMDGLLSDITNTGINNGIEFKNLQMLKEVQTDYYIEYPIAMELTGTYHSIAKFISDISNLGRIVTFHDFELKESEENNNDGLLAISIIAKTYKYEEKGSEDE